MAVLGFYGSPPGDRAPSSAYVDTRPGSTRIFQNYIANDTYTKLAAQVQGRENYWEVVIPPGLIENYKRTSLNVKNVEHYATWIASSWTTLPSLTLGDLKYFSIEIGGIGKEAMYGATVSLGGVSRSSTEYQDTYNDPWGPSTILLLDRRGDILYGSKNKDYLWGYGGDDRIEAGAGDDLINGGLGSDFIDGGEGLDLVIVDSPMGNGLIEGSSYQGMLWTELADIERRYGEVWTNRGSRDLGLIGDTFVNVERIQFTDKSVALDIDGTAGKGYRVYKAAFNREPDHSGLGYWIAQMDQGMDMVDVAARFIDSDEFRSMYGTSPSDAAFLTKVYQNVLGRDPEADGYNWWLNEIQTNPDKTRAKVLADFSESAENVSGTTELIANGIVFDAWLG